MTRWKSNIGVVSRVISATESKSDESERFHFHPTPLMTPSPCFGRRSGRITQSQCTFRRFVMGFRFCLRLRQLSFHLIVKFYASDYDSDSVASENQPWRNRCVSTLTPGKPLGTRLECIFNLLISPWSPCNTWAGGTATFTAKPKAPGKDWLSRMTKESGSESLRMKIAEDKWMTTRL